MNLPKPDFKGLTLEEALAKRRSVRDYSTKPLSVVELSQLLFAAQGITGRSYGAALRTAPSAGALYPFEIYLLAGNVAALKQGIYHYSPEDHVITLIREGDFRAELSRAALGQKAVREAAVNFILAAVVDRIKVKYGERGNRYIFMEAGHISQNIYLQAASLGLGTVVIGAFNDDEASRVMQVDGRKEIIVAIQPVGQLP
ncbi:MAG: SagB/ThcOx family dehydrogenase [Smithellaceae bacterium]|nr:SagB/ThcOx family dehydrogenase [Smithellaceae bacterium]